MANETVNRQINVFIETGDAAKAYDKLIEKEKSLNAELATTTNPRRIKELQDALAKLSEPIEKAAKKVKGELAPSLREMQGVVARLGQQLRHMSTSDADYSRIVRQYVQARQELAGIQAEARRVEEAHNRIANTNPFGRVLEFAKGSFLGGALLGVVQGAIGGITSFISNSFNEAFSAEEIGARLKSTLDNLGRGDAFDRIIRKADELAAKFKYLDNDDIVGVFNRLIDYGKLTEKQMNDLLPVIINFAAKQRISVDEATTAIVGGLEGQGKALKQYGINIKEAGSESERLNVIMTTLKDKVDGAGEAFQNTAAGGVAQAKQELANLEEEVGNKLIPVLSALLGWTSKVVTGLGFIGTKARDVATDIAAFFGDTNAKIAKLANDAQKQGAIDKQAGENLAEPFNGKSQAEIDAEIKKQDAAMKFKETLITAKARLLKEGAITQDDYDEEIKKTEQGISVIKFQLERLQQLRGAASNKKLGIDGGGGDGETGKPKVDKTAEDQRKLNEILRRLRAEYLAEEEGAEQKEIQQLEEKYVEFRKLAHGNAAQLKALDEQYQLDALAIQAKYATKYFEAFQKADAEKKKELKKMNEDLLRQLAVDGEREAAAIAYQVDKINRNNRAKLELDALRSRGRQRLAANLALLNDEERQELAQKDLTENEKLVIEEKYRQKRKAEELEYWVEFVNTISSFAQQGLDILTTFSNAKTARQNAELEADRRANDRKKQNYERMLKSGLMTRMDYDRRIGDLDKKQQDKEKAAQLDQFNRDRKIKRASIVLNGLQAVTKTLAEFGPPVPPNFLGMVAMAFTVASTAAQLVALGKEKPQFARGGRTAGPSHAQGGMAVVDSLGRKQAEVEGGEGIINKHSMSDGSRYTVSGTPSQIASRINSLHGGVSWESGATLSPSWRTATPSRINFTGIRNRFATGGVVGGTQSAAPDNSQALMIDLANTVEALTAVLSRGIWAKVLLTDINDQNDRLNALRKDATLS